MLTHLEVFVSAQIYLSDNAATDEVFAALYYAIEDLLVSGRSQVKLWSQMEAKGLTIDEIYDGPYLKNGFISDKDLVPKLVRVSLDELAVRISKIKGINAVNGLQVLTKDGLVPEINEFEIAVLNRAKFKRAANSAEPNANGVSRIKFYKDGLLMLVEPSTSLDTAFERLQLEESQQFAPVPEVNLVPEMPEGTYRNIEQYYSIQENFPEVYGITQAALPDRSSKKRQGQAKQLKGYLLVFEQLLANYLAQLNNVDCLFSFDGRQKMSQVASPTYFYQPLYSVPNVEPILIGTEDYSDELKIGSNVGFDAYKADPYNRYVQGLKHISDRTDINLDRKNRFLQHLLARFNDAFPMENIQRMNNQYGNTRSAEIYAQSQFLRNYPLLSAGRASAVGFEALSRAATQTDLDLLKLSREQLEEQDRKGSDAYQVALEINKIPFKYAKALSEPYAGLELKLNSLLQLPSYYSGVADIIEQDLKASPNESTLVIVVVKNNQLISTVFGNFLAVEKVKEQIPKQGFSEQKQQYLEVWYRSEPFVRVLTNELDCSVADWSNLTPADKECLEKQILKLTLELKVLAVTTKGFLLIEK